MNQELSKGKRDNSPERDNPKRIPEDANLTPDSSRRVKILRRGTPTKKKKVRFDSAKPKFFFFETVEHPEETGEPTELVPSTQLSSHISLLSSTHGRARRQLRDISKQTLRDCVKYGVKTRGRTVNGEMRWRFEFGNTVFITDYTCTQEITSYKAAVSIEPATITEKMRDEHNEVARTLRNNFRLCTTHSIIIVDQRLVSFAIPSFFLRDFTGVTILSLIQPSTLTHLIRSSVHISVGPCEPVTLMAFALDQKPRTER